MMHPLSTNPSERARTNVPAAQDELLLTADSLTVDAVILGTYLACAGALVALTKGRLGVRGDAASHPTEGR